MQLTIYDRNQKLFRFYKRADLIITKEHNRERITPDRNHRTKEIERHAKCVRASETSASYVKCITTVTVDGIFAFKIVPLLLFVSFACSFSSPRTPQPHLHLFVCIDVRSHNIWSCVFSSISYFSFFYFCSVSIFSAVLLSSVFWFT